MENSFEIILERLDHIESILTAIMKTIKTESIKKDRDFEDMVNISQIANLLNLSKATIYSKVSRRELPYYKLSNRLFFSKKEILD